MRQGCSLVTLPARALPSKAANKAVNRTPSAPVTFSVMRSFSNPIDTRHVTHYTLPHDQIIRG